MFSCPECNTSYKLLKSLILHLKIKHNDVSIFKCCQDTCNRIFQNIYSFKRHIILKHCSDNTQHEFVSKTDVKDIYTVTGPIPNITQDLTLEINSNVKSTFPIKNSKVNGNTFARTVTHRATQYIAKLYATYALPHNTVKHIVADFNNMFLDLTEILLDKYSNILTNHENTELHDLNSMLLCMSRPFDGMETEHLRFSKFQKDYALIKPIPFAIGQIENNVNGVLNFEKSFGHFIPPDRVLNTFLEIPGVLNKILSYRNELLQQRYSAGVSNIIQTKLWHSIAKKLPNKILLPLFLYFDDFEISNPLGSHAGVYKLGAVYYKIACLPPPFSSKLENIFLAQLHSSSDLRKCGVECVFSKLIKEFRALEVNGIEIKTPTENVTIHFAVALFLGDNLGVHQVLGLNEAFTSNYYCRYCRCIKATAALLEYEENEYTRTVENYDIDLRNKTGGIKKSCILHDLPSFNITQNIACDIMHDVYEGICRYEFGHILHNFILQEKFFSLEILNNRIKYYRYAKHQNTPPKISKTDILKKYIVISAAEMKTFVEGFALMVGDFIPHNNSIWELYLSLRQICEIISLRYVTLEHSTLLKTLIAEHHALFKVHFGNLKPKHHFLTHYPRIMDTVGPLVHVSCIRFESKHADLKVYARSIKSRVNVTYSLSVKNQLSFNERVISQRGLIDELKYTYLKSVASHHVRYCDTYIKRQYPGIEISANNFASSINIFDVCYKKGSIICCDIRLYARIWVSFIYNNRFRKTRCLFSYISVRYY